MSERHIRTATIHALAAMLLTAVISVAQTAQPSSVPAYLDPSQPVSVRVDDLVSKMTLEEKGHRYALKVEYVRGGLGTKLVWLNVISDPIAEGEEMKVDVPGFKGGDRTSLDLPKDEEDLLEALKGGAGKPFIVVLMNGSVLSVNWASEHADAILDAWYSGEEGGTAIAQTLAGVNNPAGRLPVTFYKSVEQLPAFEDYSMKNRTYRYFEGQPLYAFGYGLSYSKFEYSNLKLSTTNLKQAIPLMWKRM